MTGRTKTEIAIDCVERFSSAPRVIKISFVLTNLAFLLVIVGFATSGWVYITRSGQKASDKQGLFNHCAVAGIFTCCQSLNSYLSDNDVESVPAWFQFTRAIVGMGVTTSFIATVILYMHSFGDFDFLRRPYSIISYISGVFLLLGALVYGVMFGKDNWQRLATIHGSYGVTPFAGVLFLVAGFVTHCLDNPNQVEDLSIAQTNGRQLNVVVHPWQTQTPIGANQQGNGQPTNGRQSDVVLNPWEIQTPIGANQAVPNAPSPLLQECVVCFDREVNTAIVPCGHSGLCTVCAERCTKTCPICNGRIEQVIRLYK
ncbi:uncharacterized protein [Argopecten irradians]|uniref:uncharacterized protein isoform X1 n=1 Tax=Argopecten irradians TaxID=31199 RepID=UPI0037179E33